MSGYGRCNADLKFMEVDKVKRARKGFTIIELLIVVIVIGILAAAGLAKYQNFAETSRRKTCLGQLQTIENGLAVWETTNQAFAENAKCAWGFSPRTGKLTDTGLTATTALGTTVNPASIADTVTGSTVGAPQAFLNTTASGPLGSVIRDDKVWVCPSALSRYYNGEIQNVGDTFMDTAGSSAPTANQIGLGGRYLAAVAGRGNVLGTGTPIRNYGFPGGWIFNGAQTTATNFDSPCPQVPFKIAICGCYGTFGSSSGTGSNTPGTSAQNQGGPVGPDGSALNRHSARW